MGLPMRQAASAHAGASGSHSAALWQSSTSAQRLRLGAHSSRSPPLQRRGALAHRVGASAQAGVALQRARAAVDLLEARLPRVARLQHLAVATKLAFQASGGLATGLPAAALGRVAAQLRAGAHAHRAEVGAAAIAQLQGRARAAKRARLTGLRRAAAGATRFSLGDDLDAVDVQELGTSAERGRAEDGAGDHGAGARPRLHQKLPEAPMLPKPT